jgi:hypothetical protein
MVAYSFQHRFVAPICLGLGRDIPEGFEVGSGLREQEPKRQTIRAIGKKRHARAGELVQLYHGMRTKGCFQIGVARCVDCLPIFMKVGDPNLGPYVRIEGRHPFAAHHQLDYFARNDGFSNFAEMTLFWLDHHPAEAYGFRGVIVFWEPLT